MTFKAAWHIFFLEKPGKQMMVEPNRTKTQEKAEVSSQIKTPYQFGSIRGGLFVLFLQRRS